jgi:hypothetical protein
MAKIIWFVVTTKISREFEIKALEGIKTQISLKYGGLTIIPNSSGIWYNPKTKTLDVDKTELWLVLTNDIDAKLIDGIAKQLKVICSQTCQLYAIDDKPFFVE